MLLIYSAIITLGNNESLYYDYIHRNFVKYGLCSKPKILQFSSIHHLKCFIFKRSLSKSSFLRFYCNFQAEVLEAGEEEILQLMRLPQVSELALSNGDRLTIIYLCDRQ